MLVEEEIGWCLRDIKTGGPEPPLPPNTPISSVGEHPPSYLI